MDAYDISRDIFDPKKHYSGVRMQQGRVLTDDDWNEGQRIDNEDTRRSRIDIVGPYGSPDDGYKIQDLLYNAGDQTFDFSIDAGILYLGGLRLHHGKETYRLQVDWLEQPATAYTGPKPGDLANGDRDDLVYLEVWEQGVSAVEDGELFEPALNGPDTTTRVRNMARVRIATGIGQTNCADAWTQLQNKWTADHLGTIDADYQLVPDTTLKLSFPGSGLPADLCSPQVAGGYLGAENQAIRVQLRKNNTFTWGFDDASPFYRVTVAVVNPAGGGAPYTQVKMLTLPRDAYHWPLSGQVVEFLAWSTLLPNGEKVAARQGYIDKVVDSYDPGTQTFTLSGTVLTTFGLDWKNKNYIPAVASATANDPIFLYLRVWNRGTDTSSPAEIGFTPAASPAAVTLGNTGIAIQLFGTEFLPGDYWIIAARPETADQVEPWALQLNNGITPMGIRRLFAPLAVLQWSLDAGGNVQGNVISDCRKHFKPLTDQECCCTYTVGDGVTSNGDFNSIQEAVDSLPAEGGKLCILPGIHRDIVTIKDRRNIEICGCGPNAIVVPAAPDANTDPSQVAVFSIVSSGNIKLCSLTVLSFEGTAVAIFREDGDEPGVVCGIRVENCLLLAAMYVVSSDMGKNEVGNGNIRISNNRMGQFDVDGGVPAVFTLGDDVLIERNRIIVIPTPDKRNPNNPGGGGGDPTHCIYDRCCDKKPHYTQPGPVRVTVKTTATYVCGVTAETAGPGPYTAQGGIQIGSTSERVKILQNNILGGAGNGISFGHLLLTGGDGKVATAGKMQIVPSYNPSFSEAEGSARFNGSVYDILIAENTIQLMGLSGIGVAAVFSLENIGLLFRVDGLGIYRNRITRCALQTQTLQDAAGQAKMSAEIAFGGIVLAASENPIIRENQIVDNGTGSAYPVCGIFIQLGEKVEITHNRVLDNGVARAGDQLQTGNRGGIVIRLAVQLLDARNTTETDTPLVEGVPAADIAGNAVDQPVGLALYLVALGQVSVLGNRFTARALDTSNSEYRLANTILILDLGMSKDLLAILIVLFGSFKQLGQVSPTKADVQGVELALLLLYLFLPGGQVLFSNNQVSCLVNSFNRDIKLLLGAQLIASLDDIGYIDNQSGMTGLFTIGNILATPTFVDTILLGVTVRSNDNRWQEGLTLVIGSLLSVGMFNTCADNQATHPLGVIPATFKDNNIILFP